MLSKEVQESLDKAEKNMLAYLEEHPELLEKRIVMGYANRKFKPNREKLTLFKAKQLEKKVKEKK